MDSPYISLIASLENVYGKASAAGFGSAVYQEPVDMSAQPDAIAIKHYREFLGPKWNAERAAAWMSTWKTVYARPKDSQGDILAELASISDPDAKQSVGLLTEFIENASAGQEAMAAVFNHGDIVDLSIHSIGDGEAMSGIMVTALFSGGHTCSLVALMD